MPQRFIRKNIHKKLVRPFTASKIYKNVNSEHVVEEQVENQIKETEVEMNNIDKLKAVIGDDVKVPKRKVKVEKKDKGLIERTENSTILLTEDNKMMLND